MSKTKWILLFNISLFTAGGASSQEGKVFTLKECVETALQNNLNVQRNGLQMQADEISFQQAKLNLLPDLNGSIGHGTNQGRSIDPFTNGYINQKVNYAGYGISSGVVLFNGLSLQNAIRQNNYAYQASKMDWQQAKDNLTINVILTYLQVLNSQDQMTLYQNQLDLSEKQVQRLEILGQDGAIKPSDLSDLKGQFSNDQLSFVNGQYVLESNMITLCTLMNIPYDKSMRLERIDIESFIAGYANTSNEIYQTALSQFALVKAAEWRTKMAESAVKVQRGRMFPTLSFRASANTNYSSAASQNIFINTTESPTGDYVQVNGTTYDVLRQQNNFASEKIKYGKQLNNNIYTQLSLNLDIPLFNSLQARNRMRLAKLDLKNYEVTEHAIKTQTQRDIELAYSNMTTAFQRYKTLLEQVDAYTSSFQAAEVRFNEGVGTSIDYLTAKNNLDRANNNLIIARYDYVLRTKVLDYYQGKQLW